MEALTRDRKQAPGMTIGAWLGERLHRIGGRYGPLLLALIALYISAPLLETGFWSGRFILGCYYAVIVVGLVGSTDDGRVQLAATGLAISSYSLDFIGEADDIEPLLRVTDVSGIVLLTFSTIAVLMHVLREARVTVNTVLGGVCVYFMMSGVWAFSFALLLTADGTAFSFPPGEETVTSADALYFSLVTQTTLGFGDITPVHPLARAMAGIEALLGQIFLVVFIARLVALEMRPRAAAVGMDDSPPNS